MTLPLASGPSVTRVFVDPSLSSVEILIRIAHQIGFATTDSAADADLCIAAAPVDDRLSWCPGSGFGVDGRVAIIGTDAIRERGIDIVTSLRTRVSARPASVRTRVTSRSGHASAVVRVERDVAG